jgi:hypothetical protein
VLNCASAAVPKADADNGEPMGLPVAFRPVRLAHWMRSGELTATTQVLENTGPATFEENGTSRPKLL